MNQIPVSLAELAARHRDGIVGYLVRLLGDRQEAEDACQDAFAVTGRQLGERDGNLAHPPLSLTPGRRRT